MKDLCVFLGTIVLTFAGLFGYVQYDRATKLAETVVALEGHVEELAEIANETLLLLEESRLSKKRLVSAWHVREVQLRDEIQRLSCNQLPGTFIDSDVALPRTVTQEYAADGYVYSVITYAPGTKSEGFDGLLYKDGEMVVPEGDVFGPKPRVETPWGEMVWLGSPDDRRNLWQGCGWMVITENTEVAN